MRKIEGITSAIMKLYKDNKYETKTKQIVFKGSHDAAHDDAHDGDSVHLNGKPTKKGLYIVNGKKVVVP